MTQPQNATLEQAVTQLLDTEASLQKFVESADRLTTATQSLQNASESLDAAQQTVSAHAAAAGDWRTSSP